MSKHDEDHTEEADRLEEIHDEMQELLGEAKQLIQRFVHVRARAEAYWIPQIAMALSNEHDYLGSGSYTLAETIKDLCEDSESEEEVTGPTPSEQPGEGGGQ